MIKIVAFYSFFFLMSVSVHAQDFGNLLGGLTGALGGGQQPAGRNTGEAAQQGPNAMGAIGQALLGIGSQVAAKKISEKQNKKKNEKLQAEFERLQLENESLRSTCPSTVLKSYPEIEEITVGGSSKTSGGGAMGQLGALAQGFLGGDDVLDYESMIKKYKSQNTTLKSKCTKKPKYVKPKSTLSFGGLFGKKN